MQTNYFTTLICYKENHFYICINKQSLLSDVVKCIGLRLHRLPVLAGICPCSFSYLIPSAAGSVPISSKVNNKWKSGGSSPPSDLGPWSLVLGQIDEHIVKNVECPEQFPFKPQDFQRFDEKENRQVVSSDSVFYEAPRFVTHIDDPAIAALTKYYSKVSHFPPGYKQERIIGMGMNEEELKHNPVLTTYAVQDLNVSPKLPFEDNSFHIITNVVSVDYVTKPLDVFKEMCRILKSFSFSNRCSWTKPISIWTSTSDADHALLAGAYFQYAGGFEPPQGAPDIHLSQTLRKAEALYTGYDDTMSTYDL
ncbi:unnamed protein product [Malus baccata var. baccata]